MVAATRNPNTGGNISEGWNGISEGWNGIAPASADPLARRRGLKR